MTNDGEQSGIGVGGDVTPIGGTPGEVQFMTVAEVASKLRVSKMSVYREIHSGALKSVRFGRSFRVRQDDFHAYLQKAFYEAG